MARQIIIQERVNAPSDFNFRVVYWLAVPKGREILFADPLKTSSVKDATVDELASIQNGNIVEISEVQFFLAGTNISTIQKTLQIRFNDLQQEVVQNNNGQLLGTFFDGSTWTLGGLA